MLPVPYGVGVSPCGPGMSGRLKTEKKNFTTEEVFDIVVNAASNYFDLESIDSLGGGWDSNFSLFFIQTLKMLWHWGMHNYFP